MQTRPRRPCYESAHGCYHQCVNIMGDQSDNWRLTSEYGVAEYKCGLRAGDIVELKKPLIVHDHKGNPTGHVHPAGEVWIVLSGSKDDPGVIWFRQPDGQRHTWDDDSAKIDEWFRPIDDSSSRRDGRL